MGDRRESNPHNLGPQPSALPLSYGRHVEAGNKPHFTGHVPLRGLEPLTYSLEGCRSIQLSYKGISPSKSRLADESYYSKKHCFRQFAHFQKSLFCAILERILGIV